jgi:RNA polymerase sigma-70 factor (ECF subfamily)
MDRFRARQDFTMEPLDEEEPLPAATGRSDITEALNVADELELLREAIRALPARCRAVMELQNFQGLSNRQIAMALDISVNTVNAQLVIGLMRCRRYLHARGALQPRRS